MRSIVLSHRNMERQATDLLRDVCLQAGADVRTWSGFSQVDDLGGRAAFVAGLLPEGARRIPEDLATLVTQRIPGLPLLLWTEEPLVRPTCSLHDGLVTLLGPASSPALVTSCVRALMTDPLPTAPESGAYWAAVSPAPDEPPGASRRRSYRVGPYWIGVLEGGETLWDRLAPRAWLRTRPLSAFFGPAEDGQSLPAANRPSTVKILDEAQGPTWHFQANDAVAVSLLSAQRLPSITDLSSEPSSSLSAMPGDMVVALAPADRWAGLAPVLRARAEQDEGGAALLDFLQGALVHDPMASCLIIEKRS